MRSRRASKPQDDHTAQVFLDALLGDGEPGLLYLLALGAGAASVGTLIAYGLFRSEASLVLVFLTALGVMPVVDRVFVDNRVAHEMRVMGDRPDDRLAKSLLALFMGAFLLFGGVALFASEVTVELLFQRQLYRYVSVPDIESLQFGSFQQLITNNALVLLTVLLFAIMYRSGGVALVLLWNASVWGAVLAWVARLSGKETGVLEAVYNFFAGLVAVSPHLLFEALGYVLAAMAGVSIVRGLVKGGRITDVKRPLVQMAVALILLVLGAFTEAVLPKAVIKLLL